MPAAVIDAIAELGQQLADARRTGATIGLVPTMGALHAGHASLIERARAECATVVVSIFVNPLQFDRTEDLQRYPRSLDADVAECDRLGVDLVFAPTAAEMYPAPPLCAIEVNKIADRLCGEYRPGHFKGVATVVMKLFQIVQPDRAYFGEKDAQQLAVVRRLVADFNVPVRVAAVPTVRESDGLALSSRNQRLSAAERAIAPALHKALSHARTRIESGLADAAALRHEAIGTIPRDERLKVEYLEIVDPMDMQPVAHVSGPVVIAGAMWVGNVRLIDNVKAMP